MVETKTSINIDSETWEEFKKFVKAKHGKVKGALSQELKAALEEYMEKHQGEKLKLPEEKEKPKKPKKVEEPIDLFDYW